MIKRIFISLLCFFAYSNYADAAPTVTDPANYQVELLASGLGAVDGLTFNSSGDLYFTDYQGWRVLKISAPWKSGIHSYEVVATTGISYPVDLAFNQDRRLFVTSGISDVVEILPNGSVTPYSTGYSYPSGITSYGNTLFVSNSGNGTISKIDSLGNSSIFLSGLSSPSGPYHASIDIFGNLYFVDHATGLIYYSVDQFGNANYLNNSVSPFGGTFTAVGPNGDLFISDCNVGAVYKIDKSRNKTLFASGFVGKSTPPVIGPTGIAFDNHGYMYIGDGGNIWKVTMMKSSVVALAAGQYNMVALKSDGTVVVWGLDSSGQTDVPAGLTDVIAIAAGDLHIAALKSNGTVAAWGLNAFGQTDVPVGLVDVVAIAAYNRHTVALKSDGTVVAWGLNSSGVTDVPAGLTGVVAIATGFYHTVALKSDGTVVAWGGDSSGQTDVPSGLKGVVAVSAGDAHTVALKSDGTVVAWGLNSSGETDVPAGLTGVVAIAAGINHTVALKSDGTVVAWGSNNRGPGYIGQSTVPTGLRDVIAIDAGNYQTVALRSDGTMVAWGYSDENDNVLPISVYHTPSTTAPSVFRFAVPQIYSGLTVPIRSFLATDNSGVSGYIITETAAVPDVNALGWTVAPPASYTFSSGGAKTLYAWVKDIENNVSAPEIAVTSVPGVYTITATAGSNGNINPLGDLTVNAGGNAAFDIAPNPGYRVLSVIVDGANRGAVNSYSFTNVAGNHTISAYFKPITYTITATAEANGTISSPGVNTVNPGSSMTFTVSPTAGYHVADLLVDGVSQGALSSYSFTNVTENRTISAIFAENAWLLINASAGLNGTISPSGMGSVLGGTNQKYTMNPASGYRIADVIVDGISKGALTSYTFYSVQDAHTISVSFVLDVYNITAAADDHGSISPTGTLTVNSGGNADFMISPDAGYLVQSVIVDGVQKGSVTGYTFQNVKANHAINAYFKVATFALTASATTGGSISPVGTSIVNYGVNQPYTITPTVGYTTTDVQVDGVSQGPLTSYTFTNVTANHTIAATFAANSSYTINASAGMNGTITPSGLVPVLSGAYKKFTFTPNAGYRVADVLVDGKSMDPMTSYTFNSVTLDHTISVSFTLDVYTITAAADVNGSITPSGTQTMNKGDSQTYMITPSAGYQVRSVIVDGANRGAITTFTFTNVTANHTINAYFKLGASGTAPVVSITQATPSASQTNQGTMTLAFSVSDSSASVICSLDGSILAQPCTSPVVINNGLWHGTHQILIQATNSAGNVGSAQYVWTVDLIKPGITSIIQTPTTYTVTIQWITTELATSKLNWGQGTDTSQIIPDDGVYVTSHQIVLTDLQPNTTYSFIVGGRDVAGNTYASARRQVRTNY